MVSSLPPNPSVTPTAFHKLVLAIIISCVPLGLPQALSSLGTRSPLDNESESTVLTLSCVPHSLESGRYLQEDPRGCRKVINCQFQSNETDHTSPLSPSRKGFRSPQ